MTYLRQPRPPAPAEAPATDELKTSFELAAERARARYSAEMWGQLGPGERSYAIYDELRRIDAEQAPNAGKQR